MKYIDSIKGSIISLFIIGVLAFLIPGRGPASDVELILTVSTFLFAILYGFFITRLYSRYRSLLEVVSIEDAHWLSFFRMTQVLGKEMVIKIAHHIDRYYVCSLDYDLNSCGICYKKTAPHLDAIYKELQLLDDFPNKQTEQIYDDLFATLAQIEVQRNRNSVTSEQKITVGQWTVLLLLVGIILFCLFYLKTPLFYSQIITIMLSSVLILLVLTLRDINNLRLGGKLEGIESAQEMFDYLGKPRYYSKAFLQEDTVQIPESIRSYRVGLHNPGEEIQIKLINRGE